MPSISDPSENKLLVFISSKLGEEMTDARSIAKQAVESFRNCRVWSFEDMPASSQPLEDHYLTYVGQADWVIWLVGEVTSQAVVNEVNACMSANGRLLVFKLPALTRDEQTLRLLNLVSEVVTWHEVSAFEDLEGLIQNTLADEMNRLVRNPEPPSQRHQLEAMQRASIARCRQNLTTLGVSDELADELARDQTVGHELTLPITGLTTVFGEQGVGKTLAVERLLQRAIDAAMDDSSMPYPIFTKARDLDKPLSAFMEDQAKNYGLHSVPAILVVVDGIDEVTVIDANRLVEDAEVYVEANPQSAVVLTARPLPDLVHKGNEYTVPRLPETEAVSIMSRVSGRTVEPRNIWALPSSLQDVVTLPMFAIMLGTEFKEHPMGPWNGPGKLVERKVQRDLDALGDHQEEVNRLLKELAVKTVQAGTSVSERDLALTRVARNRLLNSRLVVENSAKFDFALAIFREYFAARAIIERDIALADLVSLSDQWIIPLNIAFHAMNDDDAQGLAAYLASSDPGLATLVFKEDAQTRLFPDSSGSQDNGTHIVHGQAIRQAMEAWSVGLGPLMHAIGPVDEHGVLRTLGVSLESGMLSTSWYEGTEQLEPVVNLPEHVGFGRRGVNLDWPTLNARSMPPTRIWPWIVTQEMLKASLKDVLHSHALWAESPDALWELPYDFAWHIASWNSAQRESPSIEDTLRAMDEFKSSSSLTFGDLTVEAKDMDAIRNLLQVHLGSGKRYVTEPWPGPDRDSPLGRRSRMWNEQFTSERWLARVEAVYGAALRIYVDIVQKWFAPFADKLMLYANLPAKFEGRIQMPQTRGGVPYLSWWPRFLGTGQESKVEFELRPSDSFNMDEVREKMKTAEAENMSRAGVSWRSGEIIHVGGRRPASEMAQKWLIDDLRDIGWTDLL